MIIFNLLAVPVGIAVLVVLNVVYYFWPGLSSPSLQNWTFGFVILLVGGAAEIVGLRARLFFLPIWVFGAGTVAYQMGVAGSVAFVGLLVLGLILINVKTRKSEAAAWEKLRYVSRRLPPQLHGNERAVWEWVQATLFLPVCSAYTPEICAHDLEVLRSLRESGVSLTTEESATIRAQEAFLEQGKSASKPIGMESKVYSPMNRLIETRLAKAQKQPTATRAASPPAVSPTPPDQSASSVSAPPTGAVDIEIMFGGYYAGREPADGKFRVFRLLDFNQEAYHAALYRETFTDLPTLAEVTALSPGIGHAPMSTHTLLSPPVQLLGSAPLTLEHLEGYLIYQEHCGVPADQRSALAARLIAFSKEPPLRLRLSLEDNNLNVTPLP